MEMLCFVTQGCSLLGFIAVWRENERRIGDRSVLQSSPVIHSSVSKLFQTHTHTRTYTISDFKYSNALLVHWFICVHFVFRKPKASLKIQQIRYRCSIVAVTNPIERRLPRMLLQIICSRTVLFYSKESNSCTHILCFSPPVQCRCKVGFPHVKQCKRPITTRAWSEVCEWS